MKSQPIRKTRKKPQPGLSSIFNIISGEGRVSLSIRKKIRRSPKDIDFIFLCVKSNSLQCPLENKVNIFEPSRNIS